MSERTCSSCGAEVPEGAAFCPECGTAQGAEASSGSTPAPPPPPPSGPPAGPPAGPSAAAATYDRTEMAGKNRPAALVAIGGGLLLLVASFLPWANIDLGAEIAEFSDFNETVTGWDTVDGDVGDGPIFAIFGLGAGVLGVLLLAGRAHMSIKVIMFIIGGLSLALSVFEVADISSDIDDLQAVGFDASLQFGVFLLVIGAAGVLVSAFLAKRAPT